MRQILWLLKSSVAFLWSPTVTCTQYEIDIMAAKVLSGFPMVAYGHLCSVKENKIDLQCRYIGNSIMYDIQYHFFRSQIIVSSVCIKISGHWSSNNGGHVPTHHDHPHCLPQLLPASVCAWPPLFDPRDCRVPLATPDGLSLP